jgi:hypothetical protein
MAADPRISTYGSTRIERSTGPCGRMTRFPKDSCWCDDCINAKREGTTP